jgi:hypothetical protein
VAFVTAAFKTLVCLRVMNVLALACVSLGGAVATAFADPTGRVIIAAMRLSEQPNYSWFSLVEDESSSHELEGRTTPAGITWVKMPMVKSVGRRLGRETDTQLEALFVGKMEGVVRVGSDWKSLAELNTSAERESGSRSQPMVRGSANAGGFGIRGGKPLGAAAPFLEERRGPHPFSAVQFGVTYPHEELALIVSSFTTMDVAGELVTGTLSDMGAALLLVRAEQIDVEPLAAAGRFKLWLKNKAVVKYQLDLEGVVLIGQWKKTNVHVNSITTLKDFGTTQVSVPDEAREKLFGSENSYLKAAVVKH